MTIAPTISTRPPSPVDQTKAQPSLPIVLRALILKELRQNLLILALVICGGALIAFASEWYTTSYLLDTRFRDSYSIFLYSATSATTWYGAIFAAFFLGLFQPFADRTFDVWAFLRHRPVPPNILYLGRVLAGMIFYTIAVGLPILFLCLRDASSHRDFYVWQYTLPSIADFFAGIPYYFAAYLIADRPTRIYGSRLIPLTLAIAGSIASYVSYYFIGSVLISLLITALLALTAEGSAISHGFTLPTPRRCRLALFLTLLLGFSLIATGGEGLRNHYSQKNSSSIIKFMANCSSDSANGSRPVMIQHSRILLPNGTLAIESTFQVHNLRGASYTSTAFTDLADKQIDPPNPVLLDQLQNNSMNFTDYDRDEWPTLRDINFREIGSLVGRYSADRPDNPRSIQWYFVLPRHLFYLYERITLKNGGKSTFLGTFGSNGLVPPGSTAIPFEGNLNLNYLRDSHTLYHIDPYEMTLSTVFQTDPGETLLHWSYGIPRDQLDYANYLNTPLRIITSRRFLAVTHTGKILAQFPLTHDPRTYQLTITPIVIFDPAEPTRKWAVRYVNIQKVRNTSMIGSDPQDYWEFYDQQGHLLSSQTFPTWQPTLPDRQSEVSFPPRLIRSIQRNNIRQGATLALASPVTVFFANIVPPVISHEIHDDRYDTPFQSFQLLHDMWVWLPMTITLVLFSAAAWILARLYRLRHPLLWALLALLCGPAALLTLFTFNSWPRRAKCPACQKLRPLNEDLCPHCKSPWPLPTPTATQIFA